MRQRSDTLGELAAALAAAQAEFTAIPKGNLNPFFKSSYAGLPAVVETASPILTKHGLAVSQFIGIDEHGNDTLTTWLLHRSGEFLAESMRLHLTKTDAQGQGSATTYARRYSYMAVLGLVADDDDDGNAAVNGRAKADAKPAPAKLATKTRVDELVHGAKVLGLLDKIQLAATHVHGSDVGDCSTEEAAYDALRVLTMPEADRLAAWLDKKAGAPA